MKSVLMRITPEQAERWLASRPANRTIRPTVVARYASDMEEGRWCTTHQGIAIDANGKLIDGQHRLAAIVRSGMTIEMLVTFDVPDESVLSIDEGLKRNICDSLLFRGTKISILQASLSAALCRSMTDWRPPPPAGHSMLISSKNTEPRPLLPLAALLDILKFLFRLLPPSAPSSPAL